jgi:adenylate cyclase
MPYSIPIPEDEEERLKNLEEYNIMDTAPEMLFDEITELAAQILECPVSTIQFLNEDRQWFKSKYGVPDDMIETPRDMALCSHTICQNDLLLVPDLTKDERFLDHSMVTFEPNMRFYAGMPLVTPKGHSIGTFCAIDFEPRELTLDQQQAMRQLSHQVVAQLELRRTIIEMNEAIKSRDKIHEDLSAEKEKSDDLLLNILPEKIEVELSETGKI